MKADSPAEKTPPLPRSLYFSMISLEGAVTSLCGFHRTISPSFVGEAASRGHPTGPADPVQEGPPTSFQETPRGPAQQLRMLSLSVRGVRAFAVFLDGTEELACFFFFKPDHF